MGRGVPPSTIQGGSRFGVERRETVNGRHVVICCNEGKEDIKLVTNPQMAHMVRQFRDPRISYHKVIAKCPRGNEYCRFVGGGVIGDALRRSMFVSKTAIYQSRDGWRLESESHAAGDGLEAAALAITNTEYKIRDKRNLKRERERRRKEGRN